MIKYHVLAAIIISDPHDKTVVRSGAGTPQVPWPLSGVVQKLAC